MSAFPFLNGSSNIRSPSFDAGRTVNLYLEPSESGTSRSAAVMYGTPGLALWSNLPGGRIRGLLRFSDDFFIAVAGPNVWRVNADKTRVLMGTVSDNTPTVSMASNGSVVMMAAQTVGYFIDPNASTVTQIASDAFTGADRVDFVDGYFVFNDPGTGKFQISGLYAETLNALDFATAEGGPDNIVSVIVDHREVWLLGQNTTEVWMDTGDVDFPFGRIQGAFLEVGCAAPQSVAKMDNSIFWLARDDRGFGTVQRANGYSPIRVSNHAVEFAIASYERTSIISDAVAYTYAQEGHSFYVLSFPTAGATWVYDAATQLWHERAFLNPMTGLLERHRSNCQVNFAGMTLVGDWQNGNIYDMNLDTFTDNTFPLPAIRVCPHIAQNAKNVIFNALELTMQTGVGLEDGSLPNALLTWSDDGGYTWGNELQASIGRIGERFTRVRWRRLGHSRDRLFKVTITDPVRRVITGAELETIPCKA